MAMCKISHHKVNEAEITVWHPNEDVESSNFSAGIPALKDGEDVNSQCCNRGIC